MTEPSICHHQIRKQRNTLKWLIRLLPLIFLLVLLTGCASVEKKFVSGTKADLGPFADNTISMLSDVDLSIKRNETIFARRFFDESGAEEKKMKFLSDNMEVALTNMVDYSITLVNLSASSRSEQEQVTAYAEYLTKFEEDFLYSAAMTSVEFGALIEKIKNQPDFLAALRSAQPMINIAAISVIKELNELSKAIEQVANKIDAKIDVEYADVIRYQRKLEDEKYRVLNAFEIIYDAYRTDKPDLSGLTESGVIWTPEIIPKGRPTTKDLQEIGKHLRARLDAMHTIQNEIQPDWEDYRAAHRELDDLMDKAVERVNRIRLIVVVWVRAHQKMASGTVDPADWFDIKDAPALLIKYGTKLL